MDGSFPKFVYYLSHNRNKISIQMEISRFCSLIFFLFLLPRIFLAWSFVIKIWFYGSPNLLVPAISRKFILFSMRGLHSNCGGFYNCASFNNIEICRNYFKFWSVYHCFSQIFCHETIIAMLQSRFKSVVRWIV